MKLPDCGIYKEQARCLSELLAVWTGLEPATPCVTGRYSNQLNYHTVCASFPIASAKVVIFLEPANILSVFFYFSRISREFGHCLSLMASTIDQTNGKIHVGRGCRSAAWRSSGSHRERSASVKEYL